MRCFTYIVIIMMLFYNILDCVSRMRLFIEYMVYVKGSTILVTRLFLMILCHHIIFLLCCNNNVIYWLYTDDYEDDLQVVQVLLPFNVPRWILINFNSKAISVVVLVFSIYEILYLGTLVGLIAETQCFLCLLPTSHLWGGVRVQMWTRKLYVRDFLQPYSLERSSLESSYLLESSFRCINNLAKF